MAVPVVVPSTCRPLRSEGGHLRVDGGAHHQDGQRRAPMEDGDHRDHPGIARRTGSPSSIEARRSAAGRRPGDAGERFHAGRGEAPLHHQLGLLALRAARRRPPRSRCPPPAGPPAGPRAERSARSGCRRARSAAGASMSGQALRPLLLGDVLDDLDEAGGPVVGADDRVGLDAGGEAGAVVAEPGGLGLLRLAGLQGEPARAVGAGLVPLLELPVALVAEQSDHRLGVQALVGPVDHDQVEIDRDEVHPRLGVGGGDPELLFVRPDLPSTRLHRSVTLLGPEAPHRQGEEDHDPDPDDAQRDRARRATPQSLRMMPWSESMIQALGKKWATRENVALVTSSGNQAPPSTASNWAEMTVVAMTGGSERKTAEMSRPTRRRQHRQRDHGHEQGDRAVEVVHSEGQLRPAGRA